MGHILQTHKKSDNLPLPLFDLRENWMSFLINVFLPLFNEAITCFVSPKNLNQEK